MLMGADTVLEVDNVWKKYPRTNKARRAYIRSALAIPLLNRQRDAKLQAGEFWALRGVSFSLARSESIAVLGLNGSGKSTLLSVLAGLALPDRGKISTLGRVAAFINLASGLQQTLSGLENIVYRGALRGKTRTQVFDDLDQVVDFAELGDFIDAPVSTYSSGMRMRLAFSIAVHENPDLLLVDEVLAVGDFRFKQKCLAKIQQLRERSCFVLVSHSMSDVSRFCDKAIVLEKGIVVHSGDVSGAIEAYLSQQNKRAEEKGEQPVAHVERTYSEEETLAQVETRLVNEAGERDGVVRTDGGFRLDISFQIKKQVKTLHIGVPIHTEEGVVLTAFSTENEDIQINALPGQRVSVTLSVPMIGLNPGTYNVILAIVEGPRFLFRNVVAKLHVVPHRALYWGIYSADAEWTLDTQ